LTRNGRDAETVVAFQGDIDIYNASELAALLAGKVEGTDGPLIIDMQDVTFCDSRGLRMLIETRHMLEQRGRQLIIRNTPARVVHLFKLTGVGGLFEWS
jgi:anti-sigma B factor antagonist